MEGKQKAGFDFLAGLRNSSLPSLSTCEWKADLCEAGLEEAVKWWAETRFLWILLSCSWSETYSEALPC